MWLHRVTNYLLTHRWQTLAIAFVVTFIPIIGIVGILIAALVTLCKGIIEGALVTVAATLPYLISFAVSVSPDATIPLVVWAAIGVAVLSNLFTWVFAVMLYKQASWNTILQTAALVGVLVVSVIHLMYPDVVTWWGNQLQSYYNQAQAVTGLLKNASASLSPETQLETINITKQYATGLMTGAILFNALLQLIVGRWWQLTIFNTGSLSNELRDIRLSQLAGALFLISLVLSYLGNAVVLDIMPILYMLFAGAGLSLIHYLFGFMKSPSAWFWLSVLYVTLIFALPTSVILVSFLALADIWVDVRKRIKSSLN